jgi:hypothetical protein
LGGGGIRDGSEFKLLTKPTVMASATFASPDGKGWIRVARHPSDLFDLPDETEVGIRKRREVSDAERERLMGYYAFERPALRGRLQPQDSHRRPLGDLPRPRNRFSRPHPGWAGFRVSGLTGGGEAATPVPTAEAQRVLER